MLKDSLVIKQRHERFVKNSCESEIVIALESKDGFATSSSNDYEDEDENPIDMICFWSDKALANSCIKEDWVNYKPVELTLAEFMENWCIGMSNDELLVGTNFDHDMFGFEIDPLELVLQLITELKRINKDVHFLKFDSLDDFYKQVKSIVPEEE